MYIYRIHCFVMNIIMETNADIHICVNINYVSEKIFFWFFTSNTIFFKDFSQFFASHFFLSISIEKKIL